MRPTMLFPLLLAAACASAPRPGPAREDLEAGLKRADLAFDQAVALHDARAFAGQVCAEAAFGGASGFAEGRDAVLRRWTPLIAEGGPRLTWAPETAEPSASGDLGFTTGSYRFEAGAGPAKEGTYVTVWRRDPATNAWCALMDLALEPPGGLERLRREAVLEARSPGGDLEASTGWLTDEAGARRGTWLEVRRCRGAACEPALFTAVPVATPAP